MSVTPILGGQEDCSLGYIVRPSQKKKAFKCVYTVKKPWVFMTEYNISKENENNKTQAWTGCHTWG